jgi:hypothetical protein
MAAAPNPKPGTPNQSEEKCVIAGDRPLFCRVAQLYAGLLRGTALRSHNFRTAPFKSFLGFSKSLNHAFGAESFEYLVYRFRRNIFDAVEKMRLQSL